MNENYVKENFIESIKGNFHDYISNLVFSLQKYVDMFYNILPELYEETRKIDNNCRNEKCYEMSSFLVSESENILKMKCRSFIYDIIKLIQNKFNKINDEIMESEHEDYKYTFSNEGYHFFIKELDTVDWSSFVDHKYKGKNRHNMKELCQFNNYFVNKMAIHEMNIFNEDRIVFDPKQIAMVLEVSYTKLIDTLERMREIADDSKSLYDLTIIVRKVINILLITYITIRYIEIIEK